MSLALTAGSCLSPGASPFLGLEQWHVTVRGRFACCLVQYGEIAGGQFRLERGDL